MAFVPHPGMASHAVDRVVLNTAVARDLAHESAVAAQAIILDDRRRARVQLDRLVEILKREAPGVAIAVLHLGEVLAEKVLRHVAVVAGGEGVVAGVLPGFVLLAHDVAVDAGHGVVGEIRTALGGFKGESARADKDAEEDAEDDASGGDECFATGRGHG